MKVLVFTTLFPNRYMPDYAVFVKERVKHLAGLCEVKVVAPVPWWPACRDRKQKTDDGRRTTDDGRKRQETDCFVRQQDKSPRNDNPCVVCHVSCNVVSASRTPHHARRNLSKYKLFSMMPFREKVDGMEVYHPRYLVIPKVLRSLYGVFMFLGSVKLLNKIREGFDFDVIDCHFAYPDGLGAVLLGKALKKKVIITCRGTDINFYTRFWLLRKLVKWALKESDFIITVSDDLKEKVIGLGISDEKIQVIPNGVDTVKFKPMPKNEARSNLGIEQDKRIILSIGALREVKGFQFLIEAMRYIREDNTALFIIGEGEYRRHLESLIKKYGLEDRVKLLGEKPNAEIPQWYSASDVFCLTSLNEGRPNVVLEALASGLPVVSMNKWGLKELVNEKSGVLLETYDSGVIEQTLSMVLAKKWDKNVIRGCVNGCRWEETAKRVYDVMEKVMGINPLGFHQRQPKGWVPEDILFFSSDDWDSGLKTSKFHLSTRLARNNRVVFINSLGLRSPKASKRDIKKIFAKLKGFSKGVREVRKNLYVYTPITIPFQRFKVVRFINNFMVLMQIKGIMRKLKFKKPLVWTFIPNSLGVIKRLPYEKLIYYCVDDMSAFKGACQKIIGKLDEELTKKADYVFSVSKELHNKKRDLNKNSFYSPHGVDFELFNKAITESNVQIPDDLRSIAKPIIGFYGLVSRDWIDYKLVKFLSDKRPEWSFVFIGKIDEDKDGLPQNKNIHYLPVKPYEELYKYSKFFDTAILPFNVNQLTEHSNPLKILEYLASGKPVVSIKIPEIMKHSNIISIASGYEEFLEKIGEALKNNNEVSIKARIEYASGYSWEHRFGEILKIVYGRSLCHCEVPKGDCQRSNL